MKILGTIFAPSSIVKETCPSMPCTTVLVGTLDVQLVPKEGPHCPENEPQDKRGKDIFQPHNDLHFDNVC